MAKIEHVKQAKDGLDVWDDILEYARTGFASIPSTRMPWSEPPSAVTRGLGPVTVASSATSSSSSISPCSDSICVTIDAV